MESITSSPGTSDGRYQVPQELMRQLHAATEQFSAARKHLDTVLDSANPTQQDVESAREHVRRAGGELDQVDERIHAVLHA